MSTTDLAQQVADLTTATTELTQEVVGQKARLTTAADTANTKASEASGSAIAAEQSNVAAKGEADRAEQEADRSKSEADRASEVAGLDTVEEAVDMALSEFAGVMTASEHDAILAQNEEKYAASGMVHMGNARDSSSKFGYAINQGLWARYPNSSYANQLLLGLAESNTASDIQKTSKSDFAISHIAGVVSSVNQYRNQGIAGSHQGMTILLPPAPDGTVVYDSTGDVRGTGKANLNLLTEVDPKYGDIAATQNEAVARAFEGNAKNGDFRLGDNGDWIVSSSGAVTITTSGALVNTNGFVYQAVANIGEEYEAIVNVELNGGGAFVAQNDGASFHNLKEGVNTVRWTHSNASDNVLFRGNAGNTNPVLFTYISVKPVTEEVVTDRVDMFGLEQFDMVIKDDEVFDMVQSQSTTFGDTDVPTVDSVRPDSFFAVYDGQTGITKGKCVKWSALTDVQKRKVAAYMKERLWINEDGDLTFTTIRQRSFAGSGNGDWTQIDSNEGTTPLQSHSPYTRKMPQGALDTYPQDSYSNGYQPFYGTLSATVGFKGVFSEGKGLVEPTGAYKGRCFFYVLGTVSRLNTGAKAKGINESGGMAFSDGNKWSSTVDSYATQLECFQNAHATLSGRDDGRLPQYIYADGLGGVVDRRLSAYDMSSPEESAKIWEKVKKGTYRGLEKLVWTTVTTTTQTAHAGTNGIEVDGGTSSFSLGDKVSLQRSTDGALDVIEGKVIEINPTYIRTDAEDYVRHAEEYRIIHTFELNTSVSGNFTMTDVIGDPANILLTDALKEGWQGSWIPVIPNNGSTTTFELPRKNVGSTSASRQYLTNVGDFDTWTSNTVAIDTTANSVTSDAADDTQFGGVMIVTYTAFAKQTKPSTNKPVLNGEAGVGSVLATCDYGTATISESLIGKILRSNAQKVTQIRRVGNPLLSNAETKLIGATDYAPTHSAISLGAPNNNSPAVKAMPYQISDNGQANIGVQANELTWGSPTFTVIDNDLTVDLTSGTLYEVRTNEASIPRGYYKCTRASTADWDSAFYVRPDGSVSYRSTDYVYLIPMYPDSWGDDSTMKITTSGSDTFVDLNGNTNLSVAHELALPIGWTHNHARASEQVEGVDL